MLVPHITYYINFLNGYLTLKKNIEIDYFPFSYSCCFYFFFCFEAIFLNIFQYSLLKLAVLISVNVHKRTSGSCKLVFVFPLSSLERKDSRLS